MKPNAPSSHPHFVSRATQLNCGFARFEAQQPPTAGSAARAPSPGLGEAVCALVASVAAVTFDVGKAYGCAPLRRGQRQPPRLRRGAHEERLIEQDNFPENI